MQLRRATLVRRATPADADALSLLGSATFLQTYAHLIPFHDLVYHCHNRHAASVYTAWLVGTDVRIWLATLPPTGTPIGYLVLAPADLPELPSTTKDAEVVRIYVLAGQQRSGVGRRLFQAAIADARDRHAARLLLGVYHRNTPAIAFYERMGLRVIGRRTMRVGGGTFEDHVMGIDLKDA